MAHSLVIQIFTVEHRKLSLAKSAPPRMSTHTSTCLGQTINNITVVGRDLFYDTINS